MKTVEKHHKVIEFLLIFALVTAGLLSPISAIADTTLTKDKAGTQERLEVTSDKDSASEKDNAVKSVDEKQASENNTAKTQNNASKNTVATPAVTNSTDAEPGTTIDLSEAGRTGCIFKQAGTYTLKQSDLTTKLNFILTVNNTLAATDVVTINLESDINTSRIFLGINGESTVIVNGNGHKVTTDQNGITCFQKTDVNLTVRDLTIVTPPASTSTDSKVSAYLSAKNKFTFENCDLQGQIRISDSTAVLTLKDTKLRLSEGQTYTVAPISNNGTVYIQGSTVISNHLNYATIHNRATGTTYIEGGTLTTQATSLPVIYNEGIANVSGGTVSCDACAAIQNTSTGTLNITGGELTTKSATYPVVYNNGKTTMTGGTIRGDSTDTTFGIVTKVAAASVEVTGGTITNCNIGVQIPEGNPTCIIGGNINFSNNKGDVYLGTNQVFTVKNDFSTTASVYVQDWPPAETKRIITTKDTPADKYSKLTSADPDYLVKYDSSTSEAYLFKHIHSWTYSASANVVTATCTSTDCEYHDSGVTLTLTAADMVYSGSNYDKATIANNITDLTGATVSEIEYYEASSPTVKLSQAPVNAGQYIAKVTIGGATAEVSFQITKQKVVKPAQDTTEYTYNGAEQTYKITDNALYTVSGNKRTNAGSQAVTIKLKDTSNYEWDDSTIADVSYTFTIVAHVHSWTYTAKANTVTASCTATFCEYHSGVTLVLTAPDMVYSASNYNKASFTNNITALTGAAAGQIEYYNRASSATLTEDETSGENVAGLKSNKLSSAPINAGPYTAKVTIGGATAVADFQITKQKVARPTADQNVYYYNGTEQTYSIADNPLYTVVGNKRTDVGSQTVSIALLDPMNYEWDDATVADLTYTFTIAESATPVTPTTPGQTTTPTTSGTVATSSYPSTSAVKSSTLPTSGDSFGVAIVLLGIFGTISAVFAVSSSTRLKKKTYRGKHSNR